MDSMGSERGSGDSGSEDDSDMESDEDDGNMEAGNGDDYRERRKFNGEDARNGADGSASALPHHEQSNRTARTNGGPGSTQRNGHDRSMAEDDAAFTQNLRNAVSADAAKGRAIKGQRGVFDALLNCRIKLQKAVIASNSITLLQPEGPCDGDGTDGTDDASRAQQLARTLAGTEKLLSQMQQLHSTQPADPGADPASPRQIWAAMERTERAATARRHAVLNKWADRTRAAQPAGRAPASRPSAQTTATDVLTAALADRPKLRARVHLARSCAPAHVARGIRSSERVYDDADFYGLLLQSLLDQRGQEAFAMAVAVAGAGTDPSTTALRGLKVKKPGLDTKASKGRRLRYTVHEKLENFMAPEDRTSWPERRVVELFSALFGHVGTLPDGDQRADWEQDQVQRPDVADEGGANGNGNGYGIGNGDVGMSGLHLFRGSRTYSTAHE